MVDDSKHGAQRGRDSGGRDGLPPLAEAKLAVPSVRHGVVHRPPLRRALDAGRDASLTLAAAPAGYGKTTAVRAWGAGLNVAPAWVTLECPLDKCILAAVVDRNHRLMVECAATG